MSRIGNTPIIIPSDVSVTQDESKVVVKGPKGELAVDLHRGIVVSQQDNQMIVKRTNNQPQTRALHGLIRSLIFNSVVGVTQGYKKTLKLIGTGYRVQAKGKGLSLALGFSHPVEITPQNGVALAVEGNDTIHIEGISKHLVGQMAANIRAVHPPEPYKGKGVRYLDEVVIKKAGKTVTK